MKTILKTTAIWAAFIPAAILNGLLREKCLVPLLTIAVLPWLAAELRE